MCAEDVSNRCFIIIFNFQQVFFYALSRHWGLAQFVLRWMVTAIVIFNIDQKLSSRVECIMGQNMEVLEENSISKLF